MSATPTVTQEDFDLLDASEAFLADLITILQLHAVCGDVATDVANHVDERALGLLAQLRARRAGRA